MSQVKDILAGLSHRGLNRTNVYPSLNNALRLIAKRLRYYDSSLVRGNLDVAVTAPASSVEMPAGYWGLISAPYILSLRRELKPLPNQQVKMSYPENSVPAYYKMFGATMELTPGASSDIVINGEYWKRPATLTKPSDEIPYNELFDDVIQEALMYVHMTGKDAGVTAAFRELVFSLVDEVVPMIDRPGPTRFQDNAGFDSLLNGDW